MRNRPAQISILSGSGLIGHNRPLKWPAHLDVRGYEGELVAVIGRLAKRVPN